MKSENIITIVLISHKSTNNVLKFVEGLSAKYDILDNDKISYQPNFGIGIKFKGIAIDYALSDIGDQSEALYSNVFSIRFDINKKINK